jgi:hypothetical protein
MIFIEKTSKNVKETTVYSLYPVMTKEVDSFTGALLGLYKFCLKNRQLAVLDS